MLGLNGQIGVFADFGGHAGQFFLHIHKCVHARFCLKQDQGSQVAPQVAKLKHSVPKCQLNRDLQVLEI